MSLKSIPLSNACPGMILARILTDEMGRTLCSAGTELNEKLIARLSKMGVSSVYIETNEQLSPEEADLMKKEIEERFARIQEGSILIGLKNILLQKIEAKKGAPQP
ncbi:MAG: hypothetical protein JW774_06085 [Candidatus Aureabacteria bacterium]|nr:hypothetical protein [Candidatus Auribacterota bacterium]